MTNETLLISINLNTQNTKITKGSLYSRTPPVLSRYELVGIYIQSLPVPRRSWNGLVDQDSLSPMADP